jgi:hypothetical protein
VNRAAASYPGTSVACLPVADLPGPLSRAGDQGVASRDLLFEDAVAEVGDTVGFDHADALEVARVILQAGEQADAAAKEDRRQAACLLSASRCASSWAATSDAVPQVGAVCVQADRNRPGQALPPRAFAEWAIRNIAAFM